MPFVFESHNLPLAMRFRWWSSGPRQSLNLRPLFQSQLPWQICCQAVVCSQLAELLRSTSPAYCPTMRRCGTQPLEQLLPSQNLSVKVSSNAQSPQRSRTIVSLPVNQPACRNHCRRSGPSRHLTPLMVERSASRTWLCTIESLANLTTSGVSDLSRLRTATTTTVGMIASDTAPNWS